MELTGGLGLLLAAVLIVAGGAKLADLRGSRDAVRNFGVPEGLAGPLGVLLPIAELGAGFALLAFAGPIPALAAAALLGAFTAGLAAALIRGRRPDCHCFGSLHSAPAGPLTLLRNAALLGAALLVVAAGGPGSALFSIWLAALIAGGGAVLSFVLARRQARRRRTPGSDWEPARFGPDAGSPTPPIGLAMTDGRSYVRSSADRPLLLVFMHPGCGPCKSLAPAVAGWRSEHGGELEIQIVSGADAESSARLAERSGLGPVLVDERGSVAKAFGSPGTPSAILIGADGTISERHVAGEPGVRWLVARATGGSYTPPHLAEEAAPEPVSRRAAVGWLAGAGAGILAAGPLGGRATAASGPCGGKCCPEGSRCKNDRCVCRKDRVKCRGKCCKPGQVCRGGRCRCPRGQKLCGGRCRRINRDERHCGACGNQCAENQTCVGGECVDPDPGCSKGQTDCGGNCVNTQSDTLNCGGCDTACRAGQVCVDGICEEPAPECSPGQIDCGGECVDTTSNASHCGGCDTACGPGFQCDGGVCVCPPGTVECSGTCVNPQTDGANCGSCGAACPPGHVCQSGSCVEFCTFGDTRSCYTGPAGTEGVGICRSGTQTCQENGTWGPCQGEVLPQPESCDGRDNNCDGFIDEGNPDGGAACTGTGGCEGVLECRSGRLECICF